MSKKTIGIIVSIVVILVIVACCLFAHQHNWGNWIIEKEATVLMDGSEYRICECGEKETRTISKIGAEKALSGKWICKSYPNNPIYMYLSFEGQNVRYGTNLFGEDVESATWDCTYKVEGTTLTLTTKDGTDFIFTVQDVGKSLRVFNDDGDEFVFDK